MRVCVCELGLNASSLLQNCPQIEWQDREENEKGQKIEINADRIPFWCFDFWFTGFVHLWCSCHNMSKYLLWHWLTLNIEKTNYRPANQILLSDKTQNGVCFRNDFKQIMHVASWRENLLHTAISERFLLSGGGSWSVDAKGWRLFASSVTTYISGFLQFCCKVEPQAAISSIHA